VRASTLTSLCGLMVMSGDLAAAAGTSGAAGAADTQFANYAFASELGSGIYAVSGRTIQVYQLTPAKAGGTFASSTEINAVIFGTGVRSDYRFEALGGGVLWRAELAYAGVYYHGDLPDDSFTRLRNGMEVRRNLGWGWHGRALQLGPYAFTDIYFNAPSGPASGISARTLQFEGGLMMDLVPQCQVRGWSLPRIGIGYRAAGVLSGWRLVIGDPF